MIDENLRGPFYGRTLEQIRADIAQRGPTAVVEDTLSAIERINPTLNAFVYVDPEDVRAQARALESSDKRGELYGVPVAVKDLIDVAGYPITLGSRVYATRKAEQDAEGVRRLREAGAIIIGITLTHEFAFGPSGDVSAYGASHNPHDPSRMTGGSSAGTGAAVGAGLVPLGLGTDTGGSIRIPAALCGTVGIKGAYGAVPTEGVFPLAPGMDHLGPLATTVEIARIGFEVLAGAPIADTSERPTYLWQDISQVPHQDPRVVSTVSRVLAELAPDAPTFPLGDWAQMRADAAAVMTRESYLVHADILDVHKTVYQEEVWDRINGGRTITDDEYRAAQQAGDSLRRDLFERLPDNAVLVSPSIAITAPRVLERESVIDGVPGVTRGILTNLTTRWNLMGFPAMSVPCGEVDGLPVGIQLVAKPGSEGALLQAAAACESLGMQQRS